VVRGDTQVDSRHRGAWQIAGPFFFEGLLASSSGSQGNDAAVTPITD
jgi:hypothetical protein